MVERQSRSRRFASVLRCERSIAHAIPRMPRAARNFTPPSRLARIEASPTLEAPSAEPLGRTKERRPPSRPSERESTVRSSSKCYNWNTLIFFARFLVLQCVASDGVALSVIVRIRSTVASLTFRGAPGRGSSCSPSSRLSMKRRRHLQTVVSWTPPSPSSRAAARFFDDGRNTQRFPVLRAQLKMQQSATAPRHLSLLISTEEGDGETPTDFRRTSD